MLKYSVKQHLQQHVNIYSWIETSLQEEALIILILLDNPSLIPLSKLLLSLKPQELFSFYQPCHKRTFKIELNQRPFCLI